MIDTHGHVWQAGSPQTAWIDKPPCAGDPTWEPLRASFPPETYRALSTAAGIDGVVLVEAADMLEETEALLAVARDHDWVFGVVGWLPLADAAAFGPALERYAGEEKLAGVRHLTNAEPDPDWVLQPTVAESIGRLGRAGLAFDFVGVTMEHLAAVPRLADACPGTTIVLDHLNNPPIGERRMQPWADGIAEAAKRPNVVAKVSGLEMSSPWGAFAVSEWGPYLDRALEAFGPDRIMLGSNWPISTLSGSLSELWTAYRAWLAALSPTEQAAISSDNARRVYRRG